jgi:hypothetical protein
MSGFVLGIRVLLAAVLGIAGVAKLATGRGPCRR